MAVTAVFNAKVNIRLLLGVIQITDLPTNITGQSLPSGFLA
jgi:hypothetical protein